MKKTYTTPELSVVLFENEDIVTTSGGNGSLIDTLLGLDTGDNIVNFEDLSN